MALLLAACGGGGTTAARDAAADDVDAQPEPALDEDAASPDGGEPEPDAGTDADEPDAHAAGVISIQFKGRVGSHAYACDRTYPGQGSTRTDVTGRAFRFFVYDVRLIDAAGAETPFALESRLPTQSEELALLDFQDPEGTCGDGTPTNTRLTGTAAPGDYRGVVFRIGVPEGPNHGDPAQASQPLRGSGMSWGWLQGYRFFIGELASLNQPDGAVPAGDASVGDGGDIGDAGQGDAEPSSGGGAHDFEPGLGLLHIGSTGCLGSPARGIACNKSNRPEIRLSNFDHASNSIAVDLGAVFATTDLATGLQCHGRGDFCASMFSALGVDLESGAPALMQSVFRVE